MTIERIVSKYLESNMYIIKENNHAILVDPCDHCEISSEYTIDYIFLTHEHYDHISGVNYWKKRSEAKVFCTEACGKNIQNPTVNLSRFFSVFCELQTWVSLLEIPQVEPYICMADEIVDDTTILKWLGHEIKVIACPGHSEGGCCYLLDDSCLFSGDSILKDGSVNFHFPGGSKKDWYCSKEKLSELPEEIKIYLGHFEPFFRAKKNNFSESQ